MKEAVEKIVRSLVGEPDAVEVDRDRRRQESFGSRFALPRAIWAASSAAKAARLKRSAAFLFVAGQKQGKRFHLDLIED